MKFLSGNRIIKCSYSHEFNFRHNYNLRFKFCYGNSQNSTQANELNSSFYNDQISGLGT